MVANFLMALIFAFPVCEQGELNSIESFASEALGPQSSKLQMAYNEFIKNRTETDIGLARLRLEQLQIQLSEVQNGDAAILDSIAAEVELHALNFSAQRLLKNDLNQDEFLELLEYKRQATHMLSHFLHDADLPLSNERKRKIKESLVSIIKGGGNLVLASWLSNLNESGLTPTEAGEKMELTNQSTILRNLRQLGMPMIESPKPSLPPDQRQASTRIALELPSGLEQWEREPNQNYDISLIVKDVMRQNRGAMDFFYRDAQYYQNLPAQFEALHSLAKLSKERAISKEERREILRAAEKIKTYTPTEKEKLRSLIREFR